MGILFIPAVTNDKSAVKNNSSVLTNNMPLLMNNMPLLMNNMLLLQDLTSEDLCQGTVPEDIIR